MADLRRLRWSIRCETADEDAPVLGLTPGQRVADAVVSVMGSWMFIIAQMVILLACITANLIGSMKSWDLYPFILLALSFPGCYAAPVIMVSQNRRQDIDRQAAENDYKVNVKAELEIELLHEKIDQLRAQEVLKLTEAARCARPRRSPGQARFAADIAGTGMRLPQEVRDVAAAG